MRSDFTQLYSEKKTARLPRVTESLFRVYESYDNNPRPKSNKGSPVQPHSRSVMVTIVDPQKNTVDFPFQYCNYTHDQIQFNLL